MLIKIPLEIVLDYHLHSHELLSLAVAMTPGVVPIGDHHLYLGCTVYFSGHP